MRVGIDWGGTKIEAIALTAGGETLARRRTPTPKEDYPGCVRAVVALVAALETEAGEVGTVGIGIPGAISPASGLVMNANSTWLIGRPLDRDLAEALGRPVRVENDANCFAVSEAVDGAGRGCRVVWGVILGTGAGSGVAIEGRALTGPNRIAGEWGHNPLPSPRDDERPGPACYCGRHGCLETFISGTGFARDFREATGAELDGPAIVTRATNGDVPARAALDRYLDRLGRGIACVVNVLDPDVIVLGGGMSNIDELYEELPGRIAPHVFSDRFATPVRRNAHGDSSGVRGAAWLWSQ
ncbi:MAG: ROK family protein [Methylobacteriaceae bacterium]|nr:ROK family protein [Methylobacteriaceae bacterium]